MKDKIAVVVILLLFTISGGEISKGMKQTQALSQLFKKKLMMNKPGGGGGGIIDRSTHFNAATDPYFATPKIHPPPQVQAILREKDRIVRLPGQPPVRFNHYGGYVTVDQTAGRAFYYYFVEAHHHSQTTSLPLLLWLNGGPGCSSLGYGAMEEVGPFRVHSDAQTLIPNPFSWNHAANVLFVESPAGVGFSYSNTTSDIVNGTGDARTAVDNYSFLVNWLERFPEYKNRDFYISGESYAGHYVPQLAHTILYHNHKLPNKTIINLKGIIIGNAVMNDETDEKGMYEYLGSHALISDDNLGRILNYCDFSSTSNGLSTPCVAALLEAETNTAALNIYNIYAPTCTIINSTINNTTTNYYEAMTSVDPCIDDYVHKYLNRPDVQEALHANLTKIPYEWQGCSEVITWKDSPSTIIPQLKDLIANGLRVWIYSGDIDGRVPVRSTKLSLQVMELNPLTPWLPWYLHGQVGGYTQVYEGGVSFATVRGAGHEVPMYQPAAALSLIMHFLAANHLPTSPN